MLALKIEKITNGQITPSQLVEDFEKTLKAKSESKALKKKATKRINRKSQVVFSSIFLERVLGNFSNGVTTQFEL